MKRFSYGEAEKQDHIGVTTGLAWTEVGGDILFIEAVDMPGKGKVTQTGKLGDVMKESIETAYSVVRAHSKDLGINPEILKNRCARPCAGRSNAKRRTVGRYCHVYDFSFGVY